MRQGLLYFFNLFIRLEKGDKGLKIEIIVKQKQANLLKFSSKIHQILD